MKKAYIYIILTAIIFSTMEIMGKIIATEINPFQLNFIRFLIGALVLLPFAIKGIKKRDIKLGKNDLLYFLFTGLLCIVISMSFFQIAIVYAMASTVAVIFCTNPMFTVPFAHFILKEKVTRTAIISVGVSLIGILCILNPFQINANVKGIILVILSAVVFALYSVVGKTRAGKYGSIANNCFTFLAGDFILLILILISHLPVLTKMNIAASFRFLINIPIIGGVNESNIFVLIYLGVVVSGLGFLFYFLAMEETSAATASIAFFIKPALAPILALIILREPIPLNTVVGILLIIIASYGTLAARKTATKSKT